MTKLHKTSGADAIKLKYHCHSLVQFSEIPIT